MTALDTAAQEIDANAAWIATQARISERAGEDAINWVDDNCGPRTLAHTLDRYMERVTAGQGA